MAASSKEGGYGKEFDTVGIDNCSTTSSSDDHRSRSPSSSGSSPTSGNRFSFCCLLKKVVAPAVILFIATCLLLYFIGGNEALPQSLQGIFPDMNLFDHEDPLNGTVYSWRSASSNAPGGLELTLLNALDAEWHPFFDKAVEQWDNGSPDSLTLNTEMRSPDPDCTRVMGMVKVCNGDYGDTGWKGINEVLLQNDQIISSAARMNEYYFFAGAFDERQYTMCHEIGHGFGLPHTDERMWNRDQGNCMDYTSRPRNNMQPDTVNFETLASVYGVVGGPAPGIPSSSTTKPVNRQMKEDDHWLRRRVVGEQRMVAKTDFPLTVQQRLEEVDNIVHGGGSAGQGWRMLHKSPHGQALEMDLGEGCKVQLHFLLA